MTSSDLAALFPGSDPATGVTVRQGVIVAWDPSTGDNTVNVGGAQLTNLPFLIAESVVLAAGDVVQLQSQGGKLYIQGKVTDPGESNIVPQWPGDIANLNDVVVPAIQADVLTAQTTADTAITTANTAADDAADALAAATTDGNPPASSPAAEVIGGIEILLVRWIPVSNADPVTYKVDVSTTTGFTPDSTTLAGTTSASQFTIKALPGDPPASPDDPDPRVLLYDTTYYVKVTATDGDGAASPGTQGSAMIFQVTGANLAADTVTAAQIAAGTITGDLLSASVIVSGEIKTGEDGQRVQLGPDGLKAYKSDNSLMVNLPTTEGEEALIDAEVISRGLTVLGGASFQGASEVTADASVTLMRGVGSPSATPQVGPTYDTIPISTTSIASGSKAGALGTFDLVPSEVRCIEWKDAATDYWVIHQVRPNGTRAWFFRVSDGAPIQVGGLYFNDYTDWAFSSIVQIPSGGTHPGVYRMGRWIPSGSAMTYYLWSPAGLNRYSRQNGVAEPALGTDGDSIFTAEVISTSLRVRYWVPNGDGNNLVTPFATYESGQGFATSNGLCTIEVGNFDLGTGRYAVSQRGVGYDAQLLNIFGTGMFPGGSGNNWASVNKNAQSFESPTTNRRGQAWDSANSCFWTFAADGLMYKHTGEIWDPVVASSNYWAKLTYYDSDATGGTHETTPGSEKTYFAKRRSKNSFTVPSIPDNGGTNDPDQVKLYMARGSSAPANSSYHLQYSGSTSTTWTTMATATATPPTSNTFPSATPATIVNDDAALVISGAGTITLDGNALSGKPAEVAAFTSSGTWNKPTGAKWIVAEVWGAGGAGGPIDGQNTGGFAEGGGGGGGGYSRKLFLATSLGSTETVTVGVGATAGLSSPAPTGGTSSFDAASATGGTGGTIMVSSTASGNAANGGGGTGSGGDVNLRGGDGGRGRTITGIPVWTNHGGAGAHGGGITQYIGTGAATGQPGKFPGGGGSGGAGLASDLTGGDGANGLVIVTTYF